MAKTLAAWALRPAQADDYPRAKKAWEKSYLKITWPSDSTWKLWAQSKRDQISSFETRDAFLESIFQDEASFQAAYAESGLEFNLPIERYTLPAESLSEMDDWYDQTDSEGKYVHWSKLVAKLQDLFRMVDAGIILHIEDSPYTSFTPLYSWAYERYRSLEEGYDEWFASF